MTSVSFDVINTTTMELKVLGVRDPSNSGTYTDPPQPFVKDEIVRLISGKYPLQDYTDTSNHSSHVYVLEKTDGTEISGILDGFTYDCTFAGQNRNLGIPQLSVIVQPPTTPVDVASVQVKVIE
jgi:hypothetical protein